MSGLVVRVVSLKTGMIVEDTEVEVGSPGHTVFQVIEYRKIFAEADYQVRIFVGPNVTDSARNELHSMVHSQNIHLEES